MAPHRRDRTLRDHGRKHPKIKFPPKMTSSHKFTTAWKALLGVKDKDTAVLHTRAATSPAKWRFASAQVLRKAFADHVLNAPSYEWKDGATLAVHKKQRSAP